MTRIGLHIGYPKTGTTSLQANVFPHIPNAYYIGSYVGQRERLDPRAQQIERAVLLSDRFHFDDLIQSLVRAVRSLSIDAGERTIILSHERFLRSLGYANLGSRHDLATTVDRLGRVFAASGCTVDVLITIRRQTDLFLSYYAQFSRQEVTAGYYRPGLESFLQFCFDDPYHGLAPHFDFLRIVKEVERVFGADHLTLIPMERLFGPCGGEALAAFCRCPSSTVLELLARPAKNVKNVGGNALTYQVSYPGIDLADTIVRTLRRVPLKWAHWKWSGTVKELLRRSLASIGPRGSETIGLSEPWRSRIAAYYSESNRLLSAPRDLRLGDLGYYEL